MIISRTQSKLDSTAEEIKAVHEDVQVETISFDFTNGDSKAYEERLLPQLDKYDIGLLGK